MVGCSVNQVTLYLSRFLKYALVEIFFLMSTITSNTPRSTDRMFCASPNPWPSQMLGVLMASPVAHRGRRRGGGVAVWRRLAPWGIGREKVSGILVRNQQTKNKG